MKDINGMKRSQTNGGMDGKGISQSFITSNVATMIMFTFSTFTNTSYVASERLKSTLHHSGILFEYDIDLISSTHSDIDIGVVINDGLEE